LETLENGDKEFLSTSCHFSFRFQFSLFYKTPKSQKEAPRNEQVGGANPMPSNKNLPKNDKLVDGLPIRRAIDLTPLPNLGNSVK
jgi:hypothetical protein